MALTRKDRFILPNGVTYLDGNSLGPLPKSVRAHLDRVVSEEWGRQLVRGWNDCGWMALPVQVGDRIASLIGAPRGSVVVGDTLSIKVYQALAAGLALRPSRRVIVSDSGNFPSDLYMAQGLISTLGRGHELRVVEPATVMPAIDASVAVVMLTEVDYRSGRKHDMASVTARAHAAGAIMVWDLAHSAGAVPVDVSAADCEFAVGCTYKYLNGGPGAPAFIYVRPDLVGDVQPALSGWLGHASPFAFAPDYAPAPSIERLRVGTPAILQMAALDEALKVWEDVDMRDLREESIALSEQFMAGVESRCPALTLASPRDARERGSHVSFAYEHGYAVMQALIAHGVIGDFRAPNLMRFGFTPLYIDETDVARAVDVLEFVLEQRLWANPEFQVKRTVT